MVASGRRLPAPAPAPVATPVPVPVIAPVLRRATERYTRHQHRQRKAEPTATSRAPSGYSSTFFATACEPSRTVSLASRAEPAIRSSSIALTPRDDRRRANRRSVPLFRRSENPRSENHDQVSDRTSQVGWVFLEAHPSPFAGAGCLISRAKPSLHSIAAVDDGLVPRLHGRCLSMMPIHSQRDEQVVGLRADGS
jgi:hypothetical protein